jgi:hypothetical protein
VLSSSIQLLGGQRPVEGAERVLEADDEAGDVAGAGERGKYGVPLCGASSVIASDRLDSDGDGAIGLGRGVGRCAAAVASLTVVVV